MAECKFGRFLVKREAFIGYLTSWRFLNRICQYLHHAAGIPFGGIGESSAVVTKQSAKNTWVPGASTREHNLNRTKAAHAAAKIRISSLKLNNIA